MQLLQQGFVACSLQAFDDLVSEEPLCIAYDGIGCFVSGRKMHQQMHMIGHDDIADYCRSLACQVIELFVNGIIGIGKLDEQLPAKAGKGDEVDATVLV